MAPRIRNTVAATRSEDGSIDPVMLTDGTAGSNGWTPILAAEADGTRTLLKVMDWLGGGGEKPALGMYLTTKGYTADKAAGFNFNTQKRVRAYSQATGTGGVAVIDYSDLKLQATPQVLALNATGNVVSAPTRSTVYDVTATSAKVRVEAMTVLTGLWNALLGATANVLVIEA